MNLLDDGSTKQLFSVQITLVFTILNFELPIVKSPGDEILSNHHSYIYGAHSYIFWPVNVDSSYGQTASVLAENETITLVLSPPHDLWFFSGL